MPYARARTVRRTGSMRSRSARAGVKLIWTYETMSLSNAGAVPSALNMLNTLLIKEGISDGTGVTWLGAHVDISAVPLAAPAAGTRDNLVMGILRASVNSTPAQLDPSSIAGRDKFKWAWLHNWPQPFTAAPVAASFTIEGTCRAHVRTKRLMRDIDDIVLFCTGQQNAAQTWHIDGLVSNLWRVP